MSEEVDFLKRHELFKDFSEESINLILNSYEVRNLKKGEIFQIQNSHDHLFILFSGYGAIIHKIPEGDYFLGTVLSGDLLNPRSLSGDSPLPDMIKGVTALKILAIPLTQLKLIEKKNGEYLSFLKAAIKKSSDRTFEIESQVMIGRENRRKLEDHKRRSAKFILFISNFLLLNMYLISVMKAAMVSFPLIYTLVNTTLVIAVGGIVTYWIKTSEVSIQEHGFNMKNWKRVVKESLF